MDKYIKESDLFKRILNVDFKHDYEGCIKFCQSIPAADVVEVKHGRHGHWIENETSYADPPTKQTCNCSICGKASTRPLGDWCRWCGAKMNEVSE